MTNVTPYNSIDYKGEFNLLLAEKELLERVSNLTKFKTSATALVLGVSEAKVCYKLKRHRIKKQIFFS